MLSATMAQGLRRRRAAAAGDGLFEKKYIVKSMGYSDFEVARRVIFWVPHLVLWTLKLYATPLPLHNILC
jgi:hypothetical protein